MQDDRVDLWATDEVHFQQHGSRCRRWIPPEIKDPVLLHAPTRKSVGYFGAVRLRDGRFGFRLESGKFHAASFLQFLQQLRSASLGDPATGCGHLRQCPPSPLPPAPTVAGPTRPRLLLWTSFPRTVPNSIPSSECRSLSAVVACTIATSKTSKTSAVRLNLSSQPGSLATMSSGGYAHLL